MLELKDLCFSASAESGTVDILKHIDLTVDGGKFIVITGPTGGGETAQRQSWVWSRPPPVRFSGTARR